MKNTRRILFALIAVMMLAMSISTITAFAADEDTVVYLTPNTNWRSDGARFAIYVWIEGGDHLWIDMADPQGDGVYEAVVPAGYTNIIFCRMNPSTTENGWSNGKMWNQTEDLTLPENGDNHYKIASGTWDKGGGSWSRIDPDDCIHAAAGEGTVLNAATCTEEGKMSYICSKCNESFTESISATGHHYDENCICDDCGAEIFYIIAGNVMKADGEYREGDNSTLFVSEWDVADENNRMFYDAESGCYVKMYENVAKGEYHFKVAENKSWDVSYGHDGGNCYLNVESDGSTVIIAFKDGSITSAAAVIAPPTNNEAPDDPTDTEEPDDNDGNAKPGDENSSGNTDSSDSSDESENTEKLNFFQKIWNAILNFFKNLFGKKVK